MQRYAVVFEQTPNNYCAYPPDLPGCVSTGETWEEMQETVREPIPRSMDSSLRQSDGLHRFHPRMWPSQGHSDSERSAAELKNLI